MHSPKVLKYEKELFSFLSYDLTLLLIMVRLLLLSHFETVSPCHFVWHNVGRGVACLIIAVLIRMGATVIAVLPSKLNMRERLFVAFSWLPKATVQAAIGPVALDTARQLHSSAEIIGYGEVVSTNFIVLPV